MSPPRVPARNYTARTLKMLWGRAAGRCAIPECRLELLVDDSEHDPIVIIGDIAHVKAMSVAGPRGNTGIGVGSRDEYDNLILLCKNCHAKIDGQKKKFTVDMIRTIKADHEAWVRASLPERGLGLSGWTALFLQGGHPIDVQHAMGSLRPDFPEGQPHVIEVNPVQEDWPTMHQSIASSVQKMFGRSDPFNRRFAIFPLAPISACVTLGFCLTDRPRIRLFQYHRHAQSWDWAASRQGESKAKVTGLTGRVSRKRGEVVICFEISAQIQKAHCNAVGQNVIGTVSLRVQRPSTSWLRSIGQLDDLGMMAHEMFESIQSRFPNATCWHILVAAPAPAAVRIGQAMNPSMTPLVQLYEFNRSTTPAYITSLRLGGNG